MRRRKLIIALAALAGICGELLAAVSTTRIAGPVLVEAGQAAGHLGFPYPLRWTLFAVISVAGWVGALLWTSPDARDRRVGPWLNLPAAGGAGVIVGLDHTVHAAPGAWQVIAFVIGPTITLTSSALLHVIARQVARDAQPPVQMTVQQHVQTRATPEIRSSEPEPEPLGSDNPDDYNPDDEPDPDEVPSVPARHVTVEQQVAWIAEHAADEPTVAQVRAQFGVSERTAFRRIEAARKARSA